ncbi:Protein SKT5 [Astathelohania contejeani]|uniref:Protein SKT5 n=1 Tax=Astathelohania contejeani TaxID=164912 RepID=A0ABQ7HXT4_9MICR|nr:Protein SKT5 [Thelohania contejeani]
MADYRKLKLTSRIIRKYRRAFGTEDNLAKIRFISEFLRLIENENIESSFAYIKKNPLKSTCIEDMLPDIEEMESVCLDYLRNYSATGEVVLFRDSLKADAQALLGLVYELGAFGVKVDYERAYGYYLLATRQNNPMGTYRLGVCFEKGLGRKRSLPRALTFYRCASKLGYVEAMHTYGTILMHGDLKTSRNTQEGLIYLKLAVNYASSSYPYPYFDFARCFESKSKLRSITPDDKYAFRLYYNGARLGCPNCCYRIGQCYNFGDLYAEVNIRLAVKWYTVAAIKGQTDAQEALSVIYFSKERKSYGQWYDIKAYNWAYRSAMRGSPEAACLLGQYIERGAGVEKDLLYALWWYRIAEELGESSAGTAANKLKNIIKVKENQCKIPNKCLFFC